MARDFKQDKKEGGFTPFDIVDRDDLNRDHFVGYYLKEAEEQYG